MIIRHIWHCLFSLTVVTEASRKLFVNLYIGISIITGIVYVENNVGWSSGENDHSQMVFCVCIVWGEIWKLVKFTKKTVNTEDCHLK